MGIFISIILAIIALEIYNVKKSITSPDILFCIEWSIITFLASLQLFTLYSTSIKTWMIILIGSISYLLGTYVGYRLILLKRVNVDSKNISENNKNFFMSKKVFWILIILMILYTLCDFSQSYKYMKLGYSLGEIREASVGMMEIEGYARKEGAFSEYMELIFSLIELFTNASGITYFIYDAKKNKKMIIAILFLEVLRSFTLGGRFGLAYIIIEIIICYYIYKKINKYNGTNMSVKIKRWIRKILIFLITIIVIVTLIRGAQTNELLKKYYRYICGNIVFFDLHVKDLDSSNFYSNSFAGLYGMWSTVYPIINRCGIGYSNTYIECIDKIMDTQTFRRIGSELFTNAFVTPFYHLYADFRWIGVIVGMFLFGGIAGNIYKKVMLNRDNVSIVCYLVIAQMIFKTIQNYPFTSKNYFWAIPIIYYVLYKNKKSLH